MNKLKWSGNPGFFKRLYFEAKYFRIKREIIHGLKKAGVYDSIETGYIGPVSGKRRGLVTTSLPSPQKQEG